MDVLESAIPDATNVPAPLRLEIEKLDTILQEIASGMERLIGIKKLSRIIHMDKHKEAVSRLRERLDEAIASFKLGCDIRTEALLGRLEISSGRTESSIGQLQLSVGQMEHLMGILQTTLGVDNQSKLPENNQSSQIILREGLNIALSSFGL